MWEWFSQFSNCINFWHRFFCFFVRGQKIVWIFDPKFPTWTKHANLSQSSSDTSSKLPHHRGFLTITIHFLLFTFRMFCLLTKKEKGMQKNWRILTYFVKTLHHFLPKLLLTLQRLQITYYSCKIVKKLPRILKITTNLQVAWQKAFISMPQITKYHFLIGSFTDHFFPDFLWRSLW